MKLTVLGSDARCFSKKFHSLGPQICNFTILEIIYFGGNFLNKSENRVLSGSWTSIFVSKLFVLVNCVFWQDGVLESYSFNSKFFWVCLVEAISKFSHSFANKFVC